MKKTYIKPEIELTIVSTEYNLLAVSGDDPFETKGLSYENGHVTDLSKGHSFDIWGEDEE